jgi:hypothetical protein
MLRLVAVAENRPQRKVATIAPILENITVMQPKCSHSHAEDAEYELILI